jgi:hypothetical protein
MGVRVSSGDPALPCEVRITDSVISDTYFGAYLLLPTFCRVINNRMFDNDYGVMATGRLVSPDAPMNNDTIIANNIVTSCAVQGIVANKALRGFSIVGNVVRGCGVGNSAGWGIVVSEGCDHFTITSNIVTSCAGGITVDPRLVGAGDTVFEEVVGSVVGNTVVGSLRATSGHGINVNYAEGMSVVGNTCGRNAGHGISVTAKRVLVDGNTSVNNTRSGLVFNWLASTGMGQHVVGVNLLDGNGAANSVDLTPDSETLFRSKVRVVGTGEIQATGQAARLRLSRMDTSVLANEVLGAVDFYSHDASGGVTAQSVVAAWEGRQYAASPNSGYLAAFVTDGFTALAEALRIDANKDIKLPNGTWNGGHFVLGVYHIWVDAGVLRIKSGAPISTSDGTVVGTQT